jgi:hypothetical protein
MDPKAFCLGQFLAPFLLFTDPDSGVTARFHSPYVAARSIVLLGAWVRSMYFPGY